MIRGGEMRGRGRRTPSIRIKYVITLQIVFNVGGTVEEVVYVGERLIIWLIK